MLSEARRVLANEHPHHTPCWARRARRYGSLVLAEVKGKAESQRDFDSAHFRVLAQYIGVFGTPANRRRGGGEETAERMDMTAPVISERKSAHSGSEAMGMTAPVISAGAPNQTRARARARTHAFANAHTLARTGKAGQECRLAFILPHQYSLATAPIPLDSRVTLRYHPRPCAPRETTTCTKPHTEGGATTVLQRGQQACALAGKWGRGQWR